VSGAIALFRLAYDRATAKRGSEGVREHESTSVGE
jgi:hypothetical protein